jgi:hypothetical protein
VDNIDYSKVEVKVCPDCGKKHHEKASFCNDCILIKTVSNRGMYFGRKPRGAWPGWNNNLSKGRWD